MGGATESADRPARGRRAVVAAAVLVALAAAPAEAYIGPGAGFALLSSFFVLFTTLLLALVSLLIWPFRTAVAGAPAAHRVEALVQAPDRGRLRRPGSAASPSGCWPRASCPTSSSSPTGAATAGSRPPFRRSRRWPGRRFSTGTNPAKHNIFDFLDRDRRTYLPRALLDPHRRGPRRPEARASWRIPLAKPELRLLRKSQAVLVDPRRAQHLEHGAAGADHVPAGQVLRRAAVGDVRARPARNPGDVPALHDPPRRRAVQGGRDARFAAANGGDGTASRPPSRDRRTASSRATRRSSSPLDDRSRTAPGAEPQVRLGDERSRSSPAALSDWVKLDLHAAPRRSRSAASAG